MIKYICMVFAGACSFGILSSFVKLAYKEGYSAAEISASQAFTGMLVLWLLVFLNKKSREDCFSFRLKWAGRWPVLFTGITIGLTTFVYYVSVQYIPASVAIVLLMQFTWMGILLDWLLFKKQPGQMELLATALILAGTIMASGLMRTTIHQLSIAGILYALASAFFYAVYVVANSRTGHTIHPLRKSAMIMTGSTAAIFMVNAPVFISSNHFDAHLIKWALFLALFGTIVPPALFSKGIPKIGAGISAIVMTAELPVAVICSHMVLKEPVDGLQWAGVLLMLLSMGLLQVRKAGAAA